MTAPNVSILPTAPTPTDSPAVFNSRAFTWVAALAAWTTSVNALVTWMNSNVGKYPLAANSTTNYILADADAGKYIRFTNTSAKAINISADATVAKTNGNVWNIRNAASGDVTLTPAGGVTVNAPSGGTLAIPTNGTASLVKIGADTYDLIGQTVPV